MEIEFRPVVGYEGLYEVSNTGIVRSLDRVVNYKNGRIDHLKGRYKRTSVLKTGYVHVMLNNNGVRCQYLVHTLVARAFIPCTHVEGRRMCVNHIDGCKTNNSITNLEWVTYSQNVQHAYDTGLNTFKGTNHPLHKPVNMLTTSGELIKTFETFRHACEFLGLSIKRKSDISRCCRGKRPTAFGYKWRYAEEV